MKNLDPSIANQGILDESFSNTDGLELDTPLQAPNSAGNVVSSGRPFSKYTSVPRTSVPIAPKSVAVISEAAKSPIDVPKSQEVQAPVYTPTYYGGGAGGYTEDDSSKREGADEKMLFGFKAKYVYLTAALAGAAFVYFKFIRK